MGTQTFCASGCFTVPPGVTRLSVRAWGGGGGGYPGGHFCCPCQPCRDHCVGGAGGGGGGYASGKIPVTPCATYSIVVGAAVSQLTNGNCSHVIGNCGKEVGGHGGRRGCNPCGGAGGTGFGCATCLVTATGGAGGRGECVGAGGGGSGAHCGGAGGGTHTAGSPPGGGGGGGFGDGGTEAGGGGAHGRVILCWTSCFNATASATPTSGRKPLCVAFSACPSGGCSPYSYAWNFGSCGGTSTCKAPHHEYLHKGTYCPTVTVSDSASHHKTPTVPRITVSAPPACCRFCASGCVTVPATVTHARVQVWGGGGSGSCFFFCGCCPGALRQGGGGGGGGYASGRVPVTACATYHVTVGGCSHFTGNCSKEVGAHPGQNSPGAGTGGAGGSGYGTACCLVTDCGEGAGVGAGGRGGGPCGGQGGAPGYYCGALAKNAPATPGCPPGGGGAGGVYSGAGRFSGASSGAHGRVVLKWCYPCAPCPPLEVTASAKPTRGKHPLAVAFKSCPTGGETPYDYLWCFACGCHAQSTAQNPSHTYPANGTYSPTLKVYCSCCYEAQPAVPQITVTCCVPPCPCTKPSQTGSINNLHIGREPIPRLSNPRRIVTCCDIGGS